MFESLREYVPGDDLADAAWKATARHNRLMIRNYETERSQNVLVVLDCGRLMVPQVDQLSRLDCAINAALLLTYVAMKQGDHIGLVAFSNRIESYVPAVKGRAALSRMNEALYRLEARLCEPDYEQVCKFLALRHRKRSLIVILTDVIDREASSTLLAYTARFARYHLPLCVTLRNLEVERLAAAEPRRAGRLLHRDGGFETARSAGGSPGPHASVRCRRAGRRSAATHPATAAPLPAVEGPQAILGGFPACHQEIEPENGCSDDSEDDFQRFGDSIAGSHESLEDSGDDEGWNQAHGQLHGADRFLLQSPSPRPPPWTPQRVAQQSGRRRQPRPRRTIRAPRGARSPSRVASRSRS